MSFALVTKVKRLKRCIVKIICPLVTLLTLLTIVTAANGGLLLKQSTTRNRVILMVDSTDHVTGKTGLTLTITASKDGSSLSSITPTVTELANGLYSLALTTTHTNTLGDFAMHISSTGADPTDIIDQVVALLPGEAVTLQADQAVNATKFGGTTVTGRDLGASVLLSSGTGTGQISLSSGTVTVGINNDKTGYSLSQAFPTNFASLSIDSNGRIDLIKVAGTTQTARDIGANVDVVLSTRLATSGYTAPPSAPTITGEVWNALAASYPTAGTMGALMQLATLQEIVNGFLNEQVEYHLIPGSVGEKFNFLDAPISSQNLTLPANFEFLAITIDGKIDVNDKTGFALTSDYDPAKIDILNVTLPGSYTGQKAGNLLWRVGNRPGQ